MTDTTFPPNVVRLTPKLRLASDQGPPLSTEDLRKSLWCCAICNSTTWYMLASHEIECAACNAISNDGDNAAWFKMVPEAPRDPPPLTSEHRETIDLGSTQAAKARTLRRGQADDAAAIIIVHTNGFRSNWYNIDTVEQREWLLDQLEAAVDDIDQRSARYYDIEPLEPANDSTPEEPRQTPDGVGTDVPP